MARQIGARMNRMAARAGQLSRTRLTISAIGALHSPSHRTAGVEERVDGGIIDATAARDPQ
jgi:hypothetical protein